MGNAERRRAATVKRREVQDTPRKPFEKSTGLNLVGRKEIRLKKTN